MGFLYTLTSLGVSLYQFSNNGNVDEIIRNFGIAISSTIAGIAFRIVFVQFRRDPMEVEHVSRLELSHAAQKVRRELDGLNLEFAHFRRTNQQMLEEGYSEIRQKVTAAADAMLADLNKFSKAAAARIQESNHALDLQSVRTQISETETAIRARNGAIALANAEDCHVYGCMNIVAHGIHLARAHARGEFEKAWVRLRRCGASVRRPDDQCRGRTRLRRRTAIQYDRFSRDRNRDDLPHRIRGSNPHYFHAQGSAR